MLPSRNWALSLTGQIPAGGMKPTPNLFLQLGQLGNRQDRSKRGSNRDKRHSPNVREVKQEGTTMKKFGFAAIIASGLAAGVLGFAAPAQATPAGTSSAADTVNSLQDAGYDVQINGVAQVPLSRCTVTGIHGLNNSNVNSANQRINSSQFDTVYVDVSCPNDGDE